MVIEYFDEKCADLRNMLMFTSFNVKYTPEVFLGYKRRLFFLKDLY